MRKTQESRDALKEKSLKYLTVYLIAKQTKYYIYCGALIRYKISMKNHVSNNWKVNLYTQKLLNLTLREILCLHMLR